MKMSLSVIALIVLVIGLLAVIGCQSTSPGSPGAAAQTTLTSVVDQVLPIVAALGVQAAQVYLTGQVNTGALDPALAAAVSTAVAAVATTVEQQFTSPPAGKEVRSPAVQAAWRSPSTREAVIAKATATLAGGASK